MSKVSSAVGSIPTPGAVDGRRQKLRSRMKNRWLLRLFFLKRLPLALIAGLRVDDLEESHCRVSVPYSWRTQNPFRSTYFAAQSMAAELSTGTLAMLAVETAPQSVAMLIVGMEATFGKKATSRATFTCEDGEALAAAVAETVLTGQPVQVVAETVGRLAGGEEVSRFQFTWSFLRRGGVEASP